MAALVARGRAALAIQALTTMVAGCRGEGGPKEGEGRQRCAQEGDGRRAQEKGDREL